MNAQSAEKGLPPLSVETQCIGCGHPDPTGLHVAGCAEAQRKLSEPVRFASVDDTAEKGVLIELACEVMHDAYEAAAVGAGWETQELSRKPWADVPDANKVTMRAAVTALISWLDTDEVTP